MLVERGWRRRVRTSRHGRAVNARSRNGRQGQGWSPDSVRRARERWEARPDGARKGQVSWQVPIIARFEYAWLAMTASATPGCARTREGRRGAVSSLKVHTSSRQKQKQKQKQKVGVPATRPTLYLCKNAPELKTSGRGESQSKGHLKQRMETRKKHRDHSHSTEMRPTRGPTGQA